MNPPRKPPTDTTRLVARNARARRLAAELTMSELGCRMAAEGLVSAWNRSTVLNLETGRRRDVSVDELLAMAVVLGCAPADLLVPPDSDEPFRPTPAHEPMLPERARAWIGGRRAPRMVLIEEGA